VFSREQEDFLRVHGKAPQWETLVPLGPIAARVWKIDPKGWKAEITVEQWTVPGGAPSIEVSVKVPWKSAASEEARLVAWLAERGVAPSKVQETKTRAALLALAAQR
jgi:hypothetical protein